MKVKQWVIKCEERETWKPELEEGKGLVLIFCHRKLLEDISWIERWGLKEKGRDYVCISTAGEYSDDGPMLKGVVVNDLVLEHSQHKIWGMKKKEGQDSFSLGKEIYEKVEKENLKFLWLFSDGHIINGEDLMNGFDSVNENKIRVSGGMAGDGADFEKTIVGMNGETGEGYVAVIGFYGDRIHESDAYCGGWWQFGPIKTVTKSKDNVVYEINNEVALDFYKKYLGEESESLPESALLFPLCIMDDEMQELVTRTILSIDMENGSMVFAGNVPEGSHVKMMRASTDELVEASGKAASQIDEPTGQKGDRFTLLVSCVGRRLVYGDRVDEEFLAVKSLIKDSLIGGFFSYGEFSADSNNKNLLHNQTLCISEIFES